MVFTKQKHNGDGEEEEEGVIGGGGIANIANTAA